MHINPILIMNISINTLILKASYGEVITKSIQKNRTIFSICISFDYTLMVFRPTA